MNNWLDHEIQAMRLALELARTRAGFVEPNPMVGCVLTKNGSVIAKGCHESFGGDHAEVAAIKSATGGTSGATAYVTLEPCVHFGKTPPCVQAILKAQIARVVIANLDPNPLVSGRGVAQLRAAGLEVNVGLLAEEAADLNAPFFKRIQSGLPWVIAKWAMSLDGKIATRSGESKWISCEASRRDAHDLRGRVDAIVVGIGTALADDPLLTARPTGPRTARRIVLDSQCRLPLTSQLARTAKDFETILICRPDSPSERMVALEVAGIEVWPIPGNAQEQLTSMEKRLADTGASNILVEGGSKLLGILSQADQIDEIQVYVAPIVIGGFSAPSPIGDVGFSRLAESTKLRFTEQHRLGADWKLVARRPMSIPNPRNF